MESLEGFQQGAEDDLNEWGMGEFEGICRCKGRSRGLNLETQNRETSRREWRDLWRRKVGGVVSVPKPCCGWSGLHVIHELNDIFERGRSALLCCEGLRNEVLLSSTIWSRIKCVYNEIIKKEAKTRITLSSRTLCSLLPLTLGYLIHTDIFSYSRPPCSDVEDSNVESNWDCFSSSSLLPLQECGVPSRCLAGSILSELADAEVSAQVTVSWLRERKPVFVENQRLGRTLEGRLLQMLDLRAFSLSGDTTQEFFRDPAQTHPSTENPLSFCLQEQRVCIWDRQIGEYNSLFL